MSALDMLDLLGPTKPSQMAQRASARFAPANGAGPAASFADFLQQNISVGTGAHKQVAINAATAGATGQTALAAQLQAHAAGGPSNQPDPHRPGHPLDLPDLAVSVNAVPAVAPSFGDTGASTVG